MKSCMSFPLKGGVGVGGGGRAGTKGATPTAAEHCAAHMKKNKV